MVWSLFLLNQLDGFITSEVLNIPYSIFGSVRREIFIVFDSVWSSDHLPHPQ
jgi:hypothetical protein